MPQREEEKEHREFMRPGWALQTEPFGPCHGLEGWMGFAARPEAMPCTKQVIARNAIGKFEVLCPACRAEQTALIEIWTAARRPQNFRRHIWHRDTD